MFIGIHHVVIRIRGVTVIGRADEAPFIQPKSASNSLPGQSLSASERANDAS